MKANAVSKILLQDPGRFVGAVRYHGFVFGVILAQFIIQSPNAALSRGHCQSDEHQYETMLVTGGMRFVGKAFFALTNVEHAASGSVVDVTVSFSSDGFLSLSSGKGFFRVLPWSLFTSSNSSFAYRFACLGTAFLACFFRLALALIWVPSTKIASVSR